MSAREVIAEVWQASREDAHETTRGQKALLGAAAVGLVAEWTATEASLVAVGNTVFSETHSPLVTALATGGTSFVEQAAFGLLTIASIKNFPSVFATVRTKKEQRKERKASPPSAYNISLEFIAENVQAPTAAAEAGQSTGKRPGLLKRFGDAFGLGTSLNALIKNSSDELSGTENVKGVISDASLIGLGVTALFGIGTEALGEHAATDVLSSPWTYAGILTLVVGSRVIENASRPKSTAS